MHKKLKKGSSIQQLLVIAVQLLLSKMWGCCLLQFCVSQYAMPPWMHYFYSLLPISLLVIVILISQRKHLKLRKFQ